MRAAAAFNNVALRRSRRRRRRRVLEVAVAAAADSQPPAARGGRTAKKLGQPRDTGVLRPRVVGRGGRRVGLHTTHSFPFFFSGKLAALLLLRLSSFYFSVLLPTRRIIFPLSPPPPLLGGMKERVREKARGRGKCHHSRDEFNFPFFVLLFFPLGERERERLSPSIQGGGEKSCCFSSSFFSHRTAFSFADGRKRKME